MWTNGWTQAIRIIGINALVLGIPSCSDSSRHCTVVDNQDGTATISCPDGTETTVGGTPSDEACTVKANPDGSITISCPDGSEWTQVPGCTTEVYEQPSYYFVIVTCPDAAPVLIGNRRMPLPGTEMLSGGYEHVCGLKPDGTVHCWGENNYGQGNIHPSRRFVSIASGLGHTCGLSADGRVLCWGMGVDGRVVSGLPVNERFVQISSGSQHVCGLRSNGTAYCWGTPHFGDTYAPSDEIFVQIVAGNAFSCGLRSDGTTRCWGWLIEGSSEFHLVNLAASGTATRYCGLDPFGRAVCQGNGGLPEDAQATYVDLAFAEGATCGLQADGTAYCMDGYGYASTMPFAYTSPADEVMTTMTGMRNDFCGLREDGTAFCWNRDGENSELSPPFPFSCLAGEELPQGAQSGIAYEQWDLNGTGTIPDFSTLGPADSTGTSANISAPAVGGVVALRIRGWIRIPDAGSSYWLRLISDGESLVRIAEHSIIAHRAEYYWPVTSDGGNYCLGAGWYPFEIEYHAWDSSKALSLEISSDNGATFAPIADADLAYIP